MRVEDLTNLIGRGAQADVCRTYLLYNFYFKEYADMYLCQYCKRTSKRKEEIIKWLPVIAGVRLSEGNQSEKSKLLELIE